MTTLKTHTKKEIENYLLKSFATYVLSERFQKLQKKDRTKEIEIYCFLVNSISSAKYKNNKHLL